jgi:hypothetical protein
MINYCNDEKDMATLWIIPFPDFCANIVVIQWLSRVKEARRSKVSVELCYRFPRYDGQGAPQWGSSRARVHRPQAANVASRQDVNR